MKLAARCRFVTTIALLALIAPHLSAEPSETDRGLAWVPVPSSGVAAPYVSAIAQGNNQIYVGGNFDTIAPITGSVALLDNTAVADGTNDGDEVIMEFPRLRGGVTAIYAVASDGNDGWYIGGDFSVTFGGLTFTNAMHVLDGGGINGDWRPNPNGIVRAIEVDTANDIVYLGGEFTSLSNSVGAAPWFDTDWPYRIAIAIDQTKVSVDESEFPVLISITDPALRDMANGGHVAQSDGGDILFIKDDATQAAHEIESYDRTTGTLVAWVEMPVSTTVTRTVYLYYGNTADASNQWDASGTWDGTSGEHEAVWHMDDGIEPDDGTIDDATGNGLTATAGNGAAEVAAFIGNGYVFDGSDDEITVGDDAAIQSQAPFTVSAWVKRSAIGEDDFILYKHGTGGDDGWGLKIEATNEITFTHFADHAGSPPQTVGGIYDTAWHHIAVTESATSGGTSTFVIYLDGQPVLSVTAASGAGNDDDDLVFGAETDDTGAIVTYSDLTMDEVRIASAAHSANWIATCYANQYSPSEFYSVGSEETRADRAYLAAVDALSGSVLPFNPAPDDTVRALELNGTTLFVGGDFASIGGQNRQGLGKIDTATALADNNFPDLDNGGNVQALLYGTGGTALGTLMVGGSFTDIGGSPNSNFAGVTVSTETVLAAGVDADDEVRAIAMTANQNFTFIGGKFQNVGGAARRWVARIDNADGSLEAETCDITDSSGSPDGGVHALASLTGGHLYIGGIFDDVKSNAHVNLVSSNFTFTTIRATNLDPLSDNANPSNMPVYALAIDAAGTVCVGGSFMGVSQMTRNNAYALDDVDDAGADYRQVTSWNPSPDNIVYDILWSEEGGTDYVYLAGYFGVAGGAANIALAKVNETSGIDVAFPDLVNAGDWGNCLVSDGTNLYVGGSFTSVGGTAVTNLASIAISTGTVSATFPDINAETLALHLYNNTLYVGFVGVNRTLGATANLDGAAAIDLSGPTVLPWNPGLLYQNFGAGTACHDIFVDTSGVYLAGLHDGNSADSVFLDYVSPGIILVDSSTGAEVTTFSTENTFDQNSAIYELVEQNGVFYCLGSCTLSIDGSGKIFFALDPGTGNYLSNYTPNTSGVVDYDRSELLETSQGALAVGSQFTGSVGSDDAHYLGEFYYSSLTVADRSGGAIGNGESPSMDGIDTDFGDLDTNKRSQPLTITLSNAGGGTIDISAITLIGTDPTEFELDTSDTDMALTGSESTTFDVYFIPATGGNKSATVQIDHNDDTGAQPFTFDVEGTALTATMTVYETDANGLVITDGSGAPGEPTERDFGIVGVDAGISDPFVVYIENTGDGTLTLGIPSLGGNDPGEFLIGLGGFSTTVLAGATTQFSVYFNPTDNAYMRADVSFDCNDPAIASPFTFEVVGFGDEPALIVAVDGAAIGDGNTAPQFPDEFVGEISVDVMTVEVRNSGLSTLTVGIPFLDGVNPDQFSLDTTGYTTPLDFSENTQFTVTFAPTSAGAKTAEIHITHDDPTDGDGVFIFQILGDGISPSALSITTETELTATYPGAAYSTTLAASGGIPSYTWTKIGGVLPPGLSLSTSGQITGTVGDSAKGQYIFAAQVEDTLGDTVNRPFSINVVAPPLNITGIAPSGVGGCALDNDHSPGATWPLAGIMLAIIATAHTIRRQRTANLR